MGYTFYADLLGIAGYYRLSPKQAYDRLNDFYDITYKCLSGFCRENQGSVEVNLFSDSLLVWGDNEQDIIVQLVNLYMRLMKNGLLLRGALVKGKFHIDPRLTLSNFRKLLPRDDSLARAAGLEKTQKGARFLIGNKSTEGLLDGCPEWLTHEGYLHNIRTDIPVDDVRRRICPTPDNKAYELLYLWVPGNSIDNYDCSIEQMHGRLTELSKSYTADISVHYKETLNMLKRCQRRKKYTEKEIGQRISSEL